MNTTARLDNASLSERLDSLSISVEEGRCVVLIGPNGAGKSTALRLLGGLETPERGRVLLNEQDARTVPPQKRAALVSWLPQRPHLQIDLLVEELVAQARYRFAEGPEHARRHGRRILEEIGVGYLIGRSVARISGGELQRVLIATLMAQDTPLLLVDEPANHLDPAHQIETYRQLGQLWQAGRGLCVVTHDVRLGLLLGAAEEIDVVGLQEGRLVFSTRLSDEQLPEALSSLYGVPFVPRNAPGGLALELPEGP